MKKIFKFLTPIAVASMLAGIAFMTACEDKASCSFESNGGTQISSVELVVGSEYTLPVPEKAGYSFEGWYLSADFSGNAVTSIVVGDADVTYYAKWEQLYQVSLDVDGGALSTTSVSLKKNANIYEAVKDLIPTKSGLVFGAWFDGSKELLQTAKMPAKNITLKAKYKVEYTIEFYGQSLTDPTDYSSKIADDVKGYGYVGDTFLSEQVLAGYVEIAHDNMQYEIVLNADKTQNVLRHYFDRRQVSIVFDANYPKGQASSEVSVSGKYGEEFEIPSNYACEGYCLIGWSTSPNGPIVKKANYIATAGVLYNATQEWTPETFVPTTDTVLYGVWSKGYTDLFGGEDYIFHLSSDSNVVYLARGDKFFEGDYEAYELDGKIVKEFSFVNRNIKPSKTLISGRLNGDGTYVYYSTSRADYTSTLYRVGQGLVETESIQLGMADEITYYEEVEGITKESTGTYKLNKNGYYEAKFTTGPKAGKTVVFTLGYVTVEGKYREAFNARNEDEYALQKLPQIAAYNGQLGGYYPMISLDGFGTATMTSYDGSTNTFTYTLQDDVLTLRSETGASDVLKIHTYDFGSGIGVVKGYSLYNSGLDQTFECENGATLVLDGMYNAVYKNGETTIKGVYTATSSALGGILLTIYDNDAQKHLFRLTEEIVYVPDESEGAQPGATVPKYVYSVEEKKTGYAEYYYRMDGEKVYYAPMIVFNDSDVENEIFVYGYNTNDGSFVKVLTATYVFDEKTGLYICTVTDCVSDAVYSTETMDLVPIKTFMFAIDTSSSYPVTYWYYYQTEDGEQELSTAYERVGSNEEKLVFVAGYAVYTLGESVTVYSYSEKEDHILLSSGAAKKYVVLDKANKTFDVLDYAPYNVSLRNIVNGTVNHNTYFRFTGKNGEVVYYVNKVAKQGTLTEEGATEWGTMVYLFTYVDGGTTKTIRFIEYSAGEKVYSVYNENYAKTYTVGTATLKLDGYGYAATYATIDKKEAGGYWVNGKVICVQLSSGTRYFDVSQDGKSATLRGLEYGDHEVVDNQEENGWTINFDGYNKYSVKYGSSSAIRGTYEIVNGTFVLSSFTYETKTFTWKGELKDDAFFVAHEEIVKTYVHQEDWSVLTLDAYGNAVKYTKEGNRETGSYLLLDESLLYYANQAGTSAGIYECREDGTLVPIKPSGKSYYSKDLKALQFTEYGFVIVNGAQRYFYNEVDGQVTIYRRPVESDTATPNEYGFIEESFGSFEDTVSYGEVQYYANSVYGNIEFNRDSVDYVIPAGQKDGQTIYAQFQDLYFTPTGVEEFAVIGNIMLYIPPMAEGEQGTTQSLSCQIVRQIVDDAVQTYVVIGTNGNGYYRIDILVEFNGVEGSSYDITAMNYVMEVQAYTFLDMYYRLYSMMGAGYANAFENKYGTIKFYQEYDKQGNVGSLKAEGSFGEYFPQIRDLNGKTISFKNVDVVNTSGIYTMQFTASDNYVYKMYVGLKPHSAFSVPGFAVYAFTRQETLLVGDYKVEVGRVLFSEESIEIGSIFSVGLSKNGADVNDDDDQVEMLTLSKDKVYFIVRTFEDSQLVKTTYYEITFNTQSSGSLETSNTVQPYTSVIVTEMEVETVKTKGKDFVDFDKNSDKALVVVIGNKMYAVESSEKKADGSYVIVTMSGTTYTIVIEEVTSGEEGSEVTTKVAVITEVKEEPSEN